MVDRAEDKHPPAWALGLVSPVLRTALRSPIGKFLPRLAVLDFVGRRTGRRYEVVTGWYEVDGQQLVVTPARWRANFANGWPLQVTNRARVLHGTGSLDTNPSSVATVIRQLLASGSTPRGLGMSMPSGRDFDEADVATTGKALVRFVAQA